MSTRTIVVDFQVANPESVEAAIGGFADKVKAAQERATQRRRGAPDVDEESGVRRIAELKEREQVKLESKLSLLREKAAQQQLRIEERERLNLNSKLSLLREKAAQQQAVREERAGLQRVSKEERTRLSLERKVAREAEREAKKAAREVERERLAGERRIAREAKAAAREQARERAAVSRQATGLVRRGLNAPFGFVAGAGRMAAGVIAGGLALGGSAGIYDSLRAGIDAERKAIALVNSTDGAVTKEQLMSRSGAIARETGFSQAKAIEGVSSFVAKTGDIDTAMKNWENFAKIARATDSEIGDIADAAADLSAKFDIKSVEDMKQAFAGLVQQGKEGAFELKDMAEQFPRIGAAARNFGWSGTRGLSQLGGLAQIARQSTPGSEEAATSVENFFNQLQVKNADLEKGKFGRRFSIYNKAGDQRSGVKDLEELAPELIDSVKGNTGKLLKILDIRGMRAIASLNSVYNDTIGKTKGTDTEKRTAAMAAVRTEITRRVDTKAANGMLDTDYQRAQGGSGEQLGRIVEDLRVEFARKLLPVLQEAVPKFRELIPALVDLTNQFVQAAPAIVDVISKLGTLGLQFANWAATNPIGAALALVSASIIKAVAVNAISSAVGSLVANVTTASTSMATVAAALGPIALALAAFGLALAFANKAADEERRNTETESDVKLGDFARRYLQDEGDTPETRKKLATVKEEIQNSTPEQYSPETKRFVKAYVSGSAIDQTQELFGMDPLDEVDREKIVRGIEGAEKASETFRPHQIKKQRLSDEEAWSMGIDPSTLKYDEQPIDPVIEKQIREDYGDTEVADRLIEAARPLSLQDIVPEMRGNSPPKEVPDLFTGDLQQDTMRLRDVRRAGGLPLEATETSANGDSVDVLAKLVEIAPLLKEAAEAQRKSAEDLRSAARAARDGFQPNRTFK